jgi:hypothetical protein
MRRVMAGVFLLAVLATGGWVAAQAMRPEVLPVSASIPPIQYHPAGGAPRRLQAAERIPTMVILFHSQCGHCHQELDLLNRDLAALGPVKLVLLTGEDTLPTRAIHARWRNLAAAPNVEWGTVRREDFSRGFGVLSTPAIFAFGPDGRLRRKVVGEAKLEFLAAALRG